MCIVIPNLKVYALVLYACVFDQVKKKRGCSCYQVPIPDLQLNINIDMQLKLLDLIKVLHLVKLQYLNV